MSETTSQEIAVRQNTTPALINPATDSWTAVVRDVAQLADHVQGTEFIPLGLRDSSAKITAAILHGRELGLPPMTALASTHIVHGRPGISAEAMRALVFQAGHEILITESTGATCTAKGRRSGSGEWLPVTWTMAMAQSAGLPAKNPATWKSYPRQMLQARATTELCRLLFPDVIHGLHSIEELQDMEPGEPVEVSAAPEQAGPRQSVQRGRKSARRTATEAPKEEAAPAAPAGREQVAIPERGKPEPEATPEQQAATEAERERQQAELAKLADQHREDKAEGNAAPLRPPSTTEQRAIEQAEAELEREAAGDTAEPVEAEIVETIQPKISVSQRASLMGHFNRLGVEPSNRAERLAITAYFAGRDQLETTNDLTVTEAAKVLQALEKLRDRDALDQALSTDSLLGD